MNQEIEALKKDLSQARFEIEKLNEQIINDLLKLVKEQNKTIVALENKLAVHEKHRGC